MANPLKAVILTALRVEFQAVRGFLDNLREDTHPSSQTVYERGEFTASGKTWEVGIVEIGPGNVEAAIETNRAIEYFNPQVVLFVGIAGGIKDVAIGDVVAATKTYGYESGKAEAKEFKTRAGVAQSSYALIQRARAEARNLDWLQMLSVAPQLEPNVWVEPIAAGEKVVASTKSSTYKHLKGNFSDAVAVEMEGYGFSRAVYAVPNVSSIVIRGISDLIDGKTDAAKYGPERDRHRKASENASAFAFQILTKFDPNPRITGTKPITPNVESPFWDELFATLQAADIAFLKTALNDVLIASNRDYPLGQIDTLSALQEVLRKFDDKDLAVGWVKRIFERVEQALEGEILFTIPSSLRVWYKANQPLEPLPEESAAPGYLLVALDPIDDEDNVRLTAELHVDGKTCRTDFVPPGTTCSVEEVCDYLSEIIPSAGEVSAVEIFLSWQHLNQPVHQWKIRSSRRTRGWRNTKELWRIPRNTLVRSLDRLQDEGWSAEWLSELEKRLKQLQALNTTVVEAEICCRDYVTEDLFEGALDKKLIFKFLSTLPEDKDELADLLYGVVESKVPIWFWAYELPADLTDFAERVDRLLVGHENLRESAMLAQLILEQRSDLQELGLLFDCHTRIPKLPALAVDESGQLRQPAA
ncbi:MAG: hypothetical protein WBA76_18915 [Phormidesmis sp.]